jgi:hypothetical protein
VPSALAPLFAQLYGDDVHDDSGTIQAIVDTAYQDGIRNISFPAGTFKLGRDINIYGEGLTFSGQGAATVFDVANNYDGTSDGLSGRGFTVRPVISNSYLMIAQPVTADTVVFQGQADVQAGQNLFLSDGFGTMPAIEQADGGIQTDASFFSSGEPDEYVQIASVTTDANGNTVAHLAKNVLGGDQFANVGPAGIVSGDYLNVTLMSKPASNITMQNFNMKFSDMQADSALYSICTLNLTVKNMNVLNSTPVGANGGIWDCASTGSVFENITSPSGIYLNSSRGVVVQNNQVSNVWLEEASTDNLITNNDLTGTTTCDLRINDMPCERNVLTHNTLHGGVIITGAIGINEGTDTTVAYNTIIGGSAFIWQGISKGSIIHDNVATALYDYHPIGFTQVFDNSWQTV